MTVTERLNHLETLPDSPVSPKQYWEDRKKILAAVARRLDEPPTHSEIRAEHRWLPSGTGHERYFGRSDVAVFLTYLAKDVADLHFTCLAALFIAYEAVPSSPGIYPNGLYNWLQEEVFTSIIRSKASALSWHDTVIYYRDRDFSQDFHDYEPQIAFENCLRSKGRELGLTNDRIDRLTTLFREIHTGSEIADVRKRYSLYQWADRFTIFRNFGYLFHDYADLTNHNDLWWQKLTREAQRCVLPGKRVPYQVRGMVEKLAGNSGLWLEELRSGAELTGPIESDSRRATVRRLAAHFEVDEWQPIRDGSRAVRDYIESYFAAVGPVLVGDAKVWHS